MSRQRYNREQLEKLREKNEANNRLYSFRKIYTIKTKTGLSGGNKTQELLKYLPTHFKEGDWQEPLLYAYFTLNYYDEEMFKIVLKRANFFEQYRELRLIFINPKRAF